MKNSVTVYSSAVDYIENCNINTEKNGIELFFNRQKINLQRNLIRTNKGNGIEINQPNPAAKLSVAENELNIYGYNRSGIQLNSFGISTGAGSIINNVIEAAFNGSTGIDLNATNDLSVHGNRITFGSAGGGQKGIAIEGDHDSALQCNTITGNTTDSSVGLYVFDGESTGYRCNAISNAGTGTFIAMGSSTPENFRQTSFSGGGTGLMLDASAAMGGQTHAGNTWSGTFSNFGAQHLAIDPIIWDQSSFTIHTNTGIYSPTLPPGQDDWFPIDPSGNPPGLCNTNTLCNVSGNLQNDDNHWFSFDEGVANGNFSTTTQYTEMGWLAKRYLFRKLNKYPNLIVPGTASDTFYNSTSLENVARFYDVEIAAQDLYETPSATDSLLTTNYDTLSWRMGEVAILDSLMATDTSLDLTAHRDAAMLVLESAHDNNAVLLDALDAQRLSDADNIIYQNAGISTSMVLEQNEKKVLDIYLNTLAKGIDTFDSLQLADLQNIAYQCPLSGGSAVFKARSLLSMVVDQTYDNDLLCTSSQALVSGNSESWASNSLFQLFPNPAKQEITITINDLDSEGGYIILMDALGKKYIQLKIENVAQSITVDVSILRNGLYFCSLLKNNKEVATQKLMIVR